MGETVIVTGPTNGERSDLRSWGPDLAVGLVVAFLAVLEILSRDAYYRDTASFVLAFGIATAVGLSRRLPGAALTLLWLLFFFQLSEDVPILLIESAIGIVAFGTARWGSTLTAVLAGASMPLAALLALAGGNYDSFREATGAQQLIDLAYGFGDTIFVGALVAATLALAAPYLAGLALRFLDRARRSRVSQVAAEEDAALAQRATEQAHEIARLRDEQARLARDVHDVVGHSLAVILAQAESAQYLADDDPDALKQTMANIATSARSSLQDVRGVLTPTSPEPPRRDGLDELIDGVRASGHEVVSHEVGAPQPLPPDLETVAYRVLQEMLTNAIKHGRRDQPVVVERHWPGAPGQGGFGHDLRIEVRNASPAADETQPITQGGGQGLTGMQRRLDSVGGRIDVRRRDESQGPTFTATAWVPVRR